MLFLTRNLELIKNREKTYLTAAVAVGATTLTVRAVDTNAWADNDYFILGEIGSKNAEILQVNGVVADGTSLTIDNNGSGGARYVHAVDEPVYRIDYNRIEFSRATTEDGSKSVLTTAEIQPDDIYTRYEDVANTSGFGFSRFNNQTSGVYSAYSDAIAYTGYTARSLGRMIRAVRRLLQEPDLQYITDDDIMEELNERQRDVAHERLWPFFEDIFSDSIVAYQNSYAIDSDVTIGKAHSIVVRGDPQKKIDGVRWDILHFDTARTGDPTHVNIWNNQIRVYPTPTDAAQTTTLNGALSASATTITVASTTGFEDSGRIIIDSEIISYTNKTSTTFRGCVRGLEESTAATHTDTTTVTERDIIYTANREPNELVDTQDETSVPDPQVIIAGAAKNLALGKLQDNAMHDRIKVDYDESIQKLRDKFGKKMTGSSYRIKDRTEVMSDGGAIRNPNDYPTIT